MFEAYQKSKRSLDEVLDFMEERQICECRMMDRDFRLVTKDEKSITRKNKDYNWQNELDSEEEMQNVRFEVNILKVHKDAVRRYLKEAEF